MTKADEVLEALWECLIDCPEPKVTALLKAVAEYKATPNFRHMRGFGRMVFDTFTEVDGYINPQP